MPADSDAAITDDAILGGRLRLRQPRRGHRVGHDAVLLAAAAGGEATACEASRHAVDLGAGVGAAGLALAVRVPGVTVTLVEIDPELAALAAENAHRNGLADRVNAVALDVAAPAQAFAAAGLGAGSAAHVLMNPPFNDPARAQPSPDPRRRLAHEGATLDVWVQCAARLLEPGGTLTFIWRADALAEVLRALAENFGAVTVLPVHPRPNAPAIRVLVQARTGSAAPLAILPGLMLNDEAGQPSAAAEAILRQGASLSMARD